MSIFRTIIQRSAAFSIPVFATRFVSVILLPVYTRYLSTADYGILELLDLTLTVFTSLCGVQLSEAVFYYLAKDEAESHRNRTLSTSFLGALMIGLIAAGLGVLNAGWIGKLVFGTTDYTRALQLYFSSLAFSLFAEAGLNQLRAVQRVAAWNSVVIARTLLLATLNVIFLAVFHLGYFSILWSSVISSAVVGLSLAVVYFRNHPIQFDGRLFLRMVRYALPLGLSGLGMLLLHYGDRFFLERVVTLSEIGIYALAYKIGMLTALVHGPFVTYWMVDMFHVVKRENGDRVYIRLFTYLTLVLAVTGTLLTVFARPIITLLSAPAYHAAAIYVPWITLAYVIRSLGDHVRSVFFTEAKTVKNTVVTGVGVAVCLVAYAVLIPRYRVWGAVAATVVAFSAMGGFGFFEAQRVRHYDFEYLRLLKIAVAAAVACAPLMLFAMPAVWLEVAAGIGMMVLFFVVLYVTRFLAPEEWNLLRSLPARLRAMGRAEAAIPPGA